MTRRVVLLLSAVIGSLLAGAPAEPAPARGWDYRIAYDVERGAIDVEICFRRFLPKRLVLAPGALFDAFGFSAAPGGARLELREESAVPVGLGPGGCVRYRIDLSRLERSRTWSRELATVGRDFVAAPGLLLLRPPLWPADAEVRVRFDMPAGYRPVVPWPRAIDGLYRIDRHALELTGLIGLGRFAVDELRVAGTVADIAVLDAPHRATREGIRAWVRAAIEAVADLYGRFPTPRIAVIVRPVPARHSPVVFGTAMRAGGGHVRLLLSSTARDEDLPGEWVAVHEMTHLGMPWTYDSEAWLQEGFVTYYQEVLRARAGFLTEREAWARLERGFQRGRRSGGERPLASESETMGREHNYHRVYWAGAAIALEIDLAVRRRTGGRQSLDDVMRYLHRAFGGTRRPMRGLDLMRAVDRWLGQPLCEMIAGACLRERAFPDLADAYRALGLAVVDGKLVYLAAGDQIAARTRIMRPGGR
jgi:hypothetical protein